MSNEEDLPTQDIEDRLLELEEALAPLFPDEEEREDLAAGILVFTENIIKKKPYQKAINFTEHSKQITREFNFKDGRRPLNLVLALTEIFVTNTGLNSASGRGFSYIPQSNTYHAALGQYISAITNATTALYFASPGAIRIEHKVVRWMCDMVGYPKETSGGYLASGGSMANFEALVCAREYFDLKAVDYPRSVIYLTEHTHYIYKKALHHGGLKEVIIRVIPCDEIFRMRASQLAAHIENDLKNNLQPWMVIANGGTTAVGSIDPIREIAAITKRHNLWLHVDAAYGGFFNLIEEGKSKFDGLNEADSIILDAHKSLFFPWSTGAILVKNRDHLLESNTFEAGFIDMHGEPEDPEATSLPRLSIELSRPFRAYHIWFTIQCLGLAPFKAAQREKLLLTHYFYERIRKNPLVEMACEPELTIVVFRIKDKKNDDDRLTQQLYTSIIEDGRIHLSTAILNGKKYIRFVPLSLQTHLAQVKDALVVINEKISELIS